MITIMHALPMSSNTDAHHSMPPIHAVATELSVAPCFRPLYFGVHWHPANHHHRGSANHRVHWADLPLGTTGEEFRRWCDGIVPRVQVGGRRSDKTGEAGEAAAPWRPAPSSAMPSSSLFLAGAVPPSRWRALCHPHPLPPTPLGRCSAVFRQWLNALKSTWRRQVDTADVRGRITGSSFAGTTGTTASLGFRIAGRTAGSRWS